ncbi:hypothetical protein GFS24_10580 [Chitinophaga sp. SYP-B3965]|uniref:hypothetical protein n=1 Tax=Chitinophaga sp. SYP-B3965 TaxID=2663120 RepID=UPI0012995FE4|nr:hypothetical protein [Chitinophaga sp. SYP-B3965]MRG45563.1 hypothetical protein [Chitinophaga sp. SYP-B3965]
MKHTTLLLLLLGSLLRADAQDANYWSSYYGPGGFFAPGAVIANNKDSGVLFYNPALLALSHKKAVSISGSIYQLDAIKIKSGAGTGKDLLSRNTSSVPQMLTGTVMLGKKKPVYISYALINAAILNFSASQRHEAQMNVLHDSYSPGSEYYIGQLTLQNQIKESTALLSAGFRLNARWAVGVTAEGASYRQHYTENVVSRALINNTSGDALRLASNELLYQVSYSHIGTRLKAGLAYEYNKHHVGLMVTSPLLHIGGQATLVSDIAIANIRDVYSGDPFNVLASTRQTKLKPVVKTPLSFAAGYAYDHAKGQVYMAAEYFFRIKEYNIITPRNEYFLRPDTGNNNVITSALLKLKDVRRAVFNVAVGASYNIKEDITTYCSFRTDFAYADNSLYTNGTGFTPYTAAWNNFHCQLGANLRRKKYNLRAGFLLAYGQTDKYLQAVNFDQPNDDNYLLGDAVNTKANHFLAGFMLAFIHNL